MQDDMIEFQSPLSRGSTALFFSSTGSTNITTRGNFDLRTKTSLNYQLHQSVVWRKRNSLPMHTSTNNLNHAGRIYGIRSDPSTVIENLKLKESLIVDSNDRFPSVKFTVPNDIKAGGDDRPRKFQLFSPSFCCNTQFQTAESLRRTGRTFLDTVLRHVDDFDSDLCKLCVEREVLFGRPLNDCRLKEIDPVNRSTRCNRSGCKRKRYITK